MAWETRSLVLVKFSKRCSNTPQQNEGAKLRKAAMPHAMFSHTWCVQAVDGRNI